MHLKTPWKKNITASPYSTLVFQIPFTLIQQPDTELESMKGKINWKYICAPQQPDNDLTSFLSSIWMLKFEFQVNVSPTVHPFVQQS